jgi:phosphomannomutase
VELTPGVDVDAILDQVRTQYSSFEVNSIDGVKIDFPDKWAHLRKSNTEPIIRIYTEAPSMEEAGELASEIKAVIKQHTCF